MIPKSCRLSYQDILIVKKQGIRTRISWILVQSMAVPEGESAKLGVVVSKKIAKSAVIRHRIKRILIDELFSTVLKSKKYTLISVQNLPEGVGSLRTVAERRAFREEIIKIAEKLK